MLAMRPACSPATTRPCRLGGVLVVHFALLVVLKLCSGRIGEVLWVSHASLLLGGIGLLIGSRLLAASAFTAVAVLHAAWMLDASCGVLTGRFPLGLTTYLLSAGPATLAATTHHVYLAPLLGWWLVRERGFCFPACFGALALMVVVTVLSRIALPAGLNINFAHAVLPGGRHPAFVWFNRQPAWVFLPIHAAACMAAVFIPAAAVPLLLLRRRAPTPLLKGSTHAHPSPTPRVHAH